MLFIKLIDSGNLDYVTVTLSLIITSDTNELTRNSNQNQSQKNHKIKF